MKKIIVLMIYCSLGTILIAQNLRLDDLTRDSIPSDTITYKMTRSTLSTNENPLEIKSPIFPSPNASSLGLYGDIPVGLYSGIPNISIPIYEVNSGDIKVPISLSYHAGGIKVSQDASWVGLGWSLNAGGIITRIVKHLDDFETGWNVPKPTLGFIEADELIISGLGDRPLIEDRIPPVYSSIYEALDNNYNVDPLDPTYRHNIGMKLMQYKGYGLKTPEDTEPDIFYYNFNGYSGKMVFPKQKGPIYTPIILNSDPILIEYSTVKQEWKIITPDGVSHYFATPETSYTTYQQTDTPHERNILTRNFDERSPIVSWYLDKIEKGQDVVNFEYEYGADVYSPFQANYSKVSFWGIPPTIVGNGSFISSLAHGQSLPSNYKFNGTSSEMLWRYPSSMRTFGISYTQSKNREVILKKISFRGGEILFRTKDRYDLITRPSRKEYTKRLDEIVVQSRTEAIVSYKLVYDYFRNYYNIPVQAGQDPIGIRLRLDELVKNSNEKHKFSYNTMYTPSKSSLAFDYWGFCNGRDGMNFEYKNTAAIPTYLERGALNKEQVLQKGADRRSSDSYSQAMMLNKITYPTKGTTEFEFEQNDFSSSYMIEENKNGNVPLEKKTLKDFSVKSEQKDQDVFQFTYKKSSESDFLTFSGSVDFLDRCNNGSLMQYDAAKYGFKLEDYYIYIEKKRPDGTWDQHLSYNYKYQFQYIFSHACCGCYEGNVPPTIFVQSGSPISYNFDHQFNLEDGEYKITVSSYEGFRSSISLSRYIPMFIEGETSKGAGLRIKKVRTSDTNQSNIKEYQYTRTDNLRLSSGKLFALPSHYYRNEQLPSFQTVEGANSNSIRTLGDHPNGLVGYTHVKEILSSESGYILGSSTYTYNNEMDYILNPIGGWGIPNYPITNYYPLNGKEEQVKTFNKSGNLIKEEEFTYKSKLYADSPIKALFIHPLPFYQTHLHRFYYIFPHWTHLSNKRTKIIEGGKILETFEEYTYEEEHRQLKTQTVIDSKGNKITTEYKYPFDPFDSKEERWELGSYEIMTKNNFLPIVAKKISKNGIFTSGIKYNYDYSVSNWDQFELRSVTSKNGNDNKAYEQRIIYHKYDKYGNPLHATKDDATNIVYLWSYNSMYPIIEIRNATYLQVETALTKAIIDRLAASIIPSDADMKLLNNLRIHSSLKGAHITTYTYKPLVGMLSATDPSGKTIFYDYDSFGRLKETYIMDNGKKVIQIYDYKYRNQ